MIKLPDLVQGDSFQYIATWEGSQLNEMKSQIRDSDNKLISDVTINQIENGKYRFIVYDTSNFPIGSLYTDIQRTTDGVIESSESMKITVIRGITE